MLFLPLTVPTGERGWEKPCICLVSSKRLPYVRKNNGFSKYLKPTTHFPPTSTFSSLEKLLQFGLQCPHVQCICVHGTNVMSGKIGTSISRLQHCQEMFSFSTKLKCITVMGIVSPWKTTGYKRGRSQFTSTPRATNQQATAAKLNPPEQPHNPTNHSNMTSLLSFVSLSLLPLLFMMASCEHLSNPDSCICRMKSGIFKDCLEKDQWKEHRDLKLYGDCLPHVELK